MDPQSNVRESGQVQHAAAALVIAVRYGSLVEAYAMSQEDSVPDRHLYEVMFSISQERVNGYSALILERVCDGTCVPPPAADVSELVEHWRTDYAKQLLHDAAEHAGQQSLDKNYDSVEFPGDDGGAAGAGEQASYPGDDDGAAAGGGGFDMEADAEARARENDVTGAAAGGGGFDMEADAEARARENDDGADEG